RWSTYQVGYRSHDWLKLPFHDTVEVVIIGWRHSESDAKGFASLLLATKSGDKFHYAGRVGTGFSQQDRHTLRNTLAQLERSTPAVEVPASDARDATWVEPKLV